jgi:DNA-binding response OmpR family regulator
MDVCKILIVDDDREIVQAIRTLLQGEGYEVVGAYHGLEALDALVNHSIQLILLDVMMPKLDGLSTMLKIRESKNIPIIMLSAKSEESDKIVGLSLGADDYVTKPFQTQELLARIKSQLRRYMQLGTMQHGATASQLVIGGLALDTDAKQLTVDGEPVKLTAKEFQILELLMSNPGVVFSADKIYERVWREEAYAIENTVMVHIRRIREKIEINPKEPNYLKVVWGIGYKMEKH